MTLYNLIITVTNEQMTNHIPFHGPGEQLKVKTTFLMAFLLLFICFFGENAAASLTFWHRSFTFKF